MSEQQKKLG